MDSKFLYKFDLDEHASGSWLYAYGSLASREQKFFDDAQLQQLFQVKSRKNMLNLMRDANYIGDSIDEALLNSEEEDLKLLRSIMPSYELIKIFLITKDSHNLKAILRSTFSSNEKKSITDIQHLFLGPYSVEPKDILEKIRQENKSETNSTMQSDQATTVSQVPDWMHETIVRAKKEYTETLDMARVDQIVEQATWKQLILLVQELKSPWLQEYYLLKADLINLEILFRCRSLNLDKTFFEFSILEESSLEKEQWLNMFSLDNHALTKKFSEYGLDDFSEFVENYHKLGQASVFTQVVDRKLMLKLKEAKAFTAQQEKIAAYFLLRDMERKNVRIARACYNNNFSPERASQLIRPAYRGV